MNENANIAERLNDIARRFPKNAALVLSKSQYSTTRISFEFFDELSNQIARGLSSDGVGPDNRVALMVAAGADFALFTFALMKLGVVPVLIDPGMGLRGMSRCMTNAAPDHFIGNLKASFAQRLLRWSASSIKRRYVIGGALGHLLSLLKKGRVSSKSVFQSRRENDHAAILFTSGSTGPAKGAVYTHGMFQEQVRVLRNSFGIEPGEVDLCTFPLFSLFAPALGMTSVVPVMDPTRPAKADPKKLIKAIFDYNVTNIFGSPALIDVLSRYGEKHDIKLPTVRRVISAGAPVSGAIIERMAKLLSPGVQVFTPYGATEALPVSVIGSNDVLHETRVMTDRGAGICVGRPIGRCEVRIIPISDEPMTSLPDSLPKGQIGEIAVSGPVVSQSYWRNPQADALHKIVASNAVWHRMGDVGYLDPQGRLWFCGRKSQRIVLPDQTLFTICCEGVFNTHSAVFRTALVNVRRRPVICIELENSHDRLDTKKVIDDLRALSLGFAFTRIINDFLIYPRSFPVDIRHNAKIDREQLGVWAARKLR